MNESRDAGLRQRPNITGPKSEFKIRDLDVAGLNFHNMDGL